MHRSAETADPEPILLHAFLLGDQARCLLTCPVGSTVIRVASLGQTIELAAVVQRATWPRLKELGIEYQLQLARRLRRGQCDDYGGGRASIAAESFPAIDERAALKQSRSVTRNCVRLDKTEVWKLLVVPRIGRMTSAPKENFFERSGDATSARKPTEIESA